MLLLSRQNDGIPAGKETAMNIEDFTPEQIERARACKTHEELLELVAR